MALSSEEDVVVALDPGREKCGLAILTLSGRVLSRQVVAPDQVSQTIASLLDSRGAEALVIGNRTAKQNLLRAIEEPLLRRFRRGVVEVDEHLSSVEARMRYLDDHRPKGISRLIPKGMRIPAEPFDDYAAVVLAERYLRSLHEDPNRSSESSEQDTD